MSGECHAPAWFRSPDSRFRPAAFWFWHRIPTPPEIDRQLADMRDKHIGTVMVQARPALGLDVYLSPAYLAAYRLAAGKAAELGVALVVYDEYGWMSCHGGGRTVEGADHLRERHLFWTSGPARSGTTVLTVSNIRAPFLDFLGETGRDWCYEGGVARWGGWQAVAAVAHSPDGVPSVDRVQPLACPVTIEPVGWTSCRIVVEHGDAVADGATVTAFASARCLTSRLVNYLMPEAAERFAEMVYGPLLEASEGTARAFFFDHPYAGFHLWDELRGAMGNSLLWHEGLPDEPVQLLAVVQDVGPRTAALRSAFHAQYCARVNDAFFGTLSRWTAARGLGFIGHELLTHVGAWGLHEGLPGIDPRSMPGVDYFAVDAYRSETVVDAADYAPQLSARFGDSVARANGRRRCMVEQYSTGRETGTASLAGQWGLTAERFRAQAIRHLLFGARQILLHAVNVTDGHDCDDRLLVNPRFDFPPGFNFEPWWDDCPAIFSELSRLSAFLEDGEPQRPVALFYPLETIRAEAAMPTCGEHFGWWAEALARAGMGYDIVDERALRSTLQSGRYETLVLPAVSTLASVATAETIAAFVGRGGRLMLSGGLPHKTRARGEDSECETIFAALVIGDEQVVHMRDASYEAIEQAVQRHPRPPLHAAFAEGPTWSTISACAGGWRLAAFNDTSEPHVLVIHHPRPALRMKRWDPDSGDVRCYGGDLSGDSVALTLGPHEVLCLSIEAGDKDPTTPTHEAPIAATARSLRPAPDDVVIELAEGWTLEIEGCGPKPVEVDRGWEVQGHPAFAGTGIYRRRLRLDATADGSLWRLLLPEFHGTADIWAGPVMIGRHVAGQAIFDLPDTQNEVMLEIRVRNTAANRYYYGTPYGGAKQPSGITKPPLLIRSATRVQ